MSAHEVRAKVREAIEAKSKTEIQFLVSGSATDYPNYQRRIGRLQAFGEALEEIEAAYHEVMGG